MAPIRFALAFGIVYLGVGALGFMPAALSPPGDGPTVLVDALHGKLLGLFAVNLPHTLVHVAIGLWGVFAARSLHGARIYLRSLAAIYGVLAIMGLIPGFNTLFGLLPLHGHDVWLHAVTALLAAYAGFAVTSSERVPGPHAAR